MAVRTPVVGGANDTPEEIAGIARFVRGFRGLRYYELIPYHALGESKRKSLGLPAETRFHTPSGETMERLADAAREKENVKRFLPGHQSSSQVRRRPS